MAGSLTNLIFHIIFSTKKREKLIIPELREQLYPYIGGVIHGENGRLLKIGGMAEHVHLLTVLPASISLSEMLRRIKGNSSRWVNDKKILRCRFSWQRGYGAFSVSESNWKDVARYIENQVIHHKKITFKEEFLMFLKKHNVPYDERYIWK